MTDNFHHISVLRDETVIHTLPTSQLIENLKKEKQNTIHVIDATLGGAGHACSFIQKFFENSLCKEFKLHFVGIDQDAVAIKTATKKLNALKKEHTNLTITIFHANFDQLEELLASSKKISKNAKIHALYADFGVSSPQLDTHERGFSLMHEGPLDMRMDQQSSLTAEKILLSYPEGELARIFYEYGEEPKSRILARAILKDRNENKLPTTNTKIFAEYVKRVLKYGYSRSHPATRIFQALRIEVNNELRAIETLLNLTPTLMHQHSRAGFISFHSLEDRLVKRSMRTWQAEQYGKESPRGGIVPTQEELAKNIRARSARLRVFDFIG